MRARREGAVPASRQALRFSAGGAGAAGAAAALAAEGPGSSGGSPIFSRIFPSTSAATSALSRRNCFAFSRPLADAQVAVAEPGAALLDHLVLDPQVDELAGAGDPLAVVDVELGAPERRGDLVLDDLDLRARLPTTSSPSLIDAIRRMSIRTEE